MRTRTSRWPRRSARGLRGIEQKLALGAIRSAAMPTRGRTPRQRGRAARHACGKRPSACGHRAAGGGELFGDDFVEHFVATREWEERQFRRAVTDWELARYWSHLSKHGKPLTETASTFPA